MKPKRTYKDSLPQKARETISVNTRQAKKLEQIKRFRYIDDTFFSVALDKFKPGVELILQIVTGNSDMRVKTVHTQATVINLYGKSVRFDIFAADKENRYNCEIQREDRGASPKRARYNSAIIDSREIAEGTDSAKLPGNIVIFICENDVLGRSLPLYHIRRKIEETGAVFDDGTLIIYVNGAYRGDDPLGRLMHDFFCDSPEDMHYKVLADRMQFVKTNEKGVRKMCRIMEEFVKEEVAIAAKRAEKRGEKRGEERGEKRGTMQATLVSIRHLMKKLHMTAAEAMNLLEVPLSEQEKYASQL